PCRKSVRMPSVNIPTRGFTIVELLITMVVAAILAGIAAPSVRDIIFNNRITSASNDLVVDISTARSEAARRGVRIAVCMNDGTDAACSTSSTWAAGWLTFVDSNGDGAVSTGETILRVHQALPTGLAVTASGVGNIVYARPVGNVTPTGSWKICDSRV